MKNTIKTLKAKIAARSTEELYLVVRTFGSDRTDREANIVRGFCLSEIEGRLGAEAVDQLMDEIGL